MTITETRQPVSPCKCCGHAESEHSPLTRYCRHDYEPYAEKPTRAQREQCLCLGYVREFGEPTP